MRFSATVAIPTLAADYALEECLQSLAHQTFRPFEILVVDNSGRGLVRQRNATLPPSTRVIEMQHNTGFGVAINAAIAASDAPFIATLNDDAVADPEWLASLVETMEQHPEAGLCASQVRLAEGGSLDSAGMLLCRDGSSKQRGHGQNPAQFASDEEVLLASASAALYRRKMLDEIGAFDPDFFLYCEDTDLGLRAVRAGWRCLYVPAARVDHRYSHSAGRVSALKAYLVERNRLFVVVKNFPLSWLMAVPFVALVRYMWHLVFLVRGQGAAASFRREGQGGGWQLGWFVFKAHLALFRHARTLWRKRQAIQHSAKLSDQEFLGILSRFSISPQAVAEL